MSKWVAMENEIKTETGVQKARTSSLQAEEAGPGCARSTSRCLNSEAKRAGLAALLGEELLLTAGWDRHGP